MILKTRLMGFSSHSKMTQRNGSRLLSGPNVRADLLKLILYCARSVPPLRHAFAHAPEIWKLCIRGKDSTKRVAHKLGLDEDQVMAAASTLRPLRRCPSPERMAVIVMNDPEFTDDDIAVMFGRSEKWARIVRSLSSEIRDNEKLVESLYPWMYNGDPSPQEIDILKREANYLYNTGQLLHVRKVFFDQRRLENNSDESIIGREGSEDFGAGANSSPALEGTRET